jgi:hypothetical protein
MRASLASKSALKHFDFAHRPDPLIEIGALHVSDNPMGAVLSIGMLVIVWGALPVVRPFLVAAIGLGVLFGAVLWVRRR